MSIKYSLYLFSLICISLSSCRRASKSHAPQEPVESNAQALPDENVREFSLVEGLSNNAKKILAEKTPGLQDFGKKIYDKVMAYEGDIKDISSEKLMQLIGAEGSFDRILSPVVTAPGDRFGSMSAYTLGTEGLNLATQRNYMTAIVAMNQYMSTLAQNAGDSVAYRVDDPKIYDFHLKYAALTLNATKPGSALGKIGLISEHFDFHDPDDFRTFMKNQFTMSGYNYDGYTAPKGTKNLNNRYAYTRNPAKGRSSHLDKISLGQIGLDLRVKVWYGTRWYSNSWPFLPNQKTHLIIDQYKTPTGASSYIKPEAVGLGTWFEKISHGTDFINSYFHVSEDYRGEKLFKVKGWKELSNSLGVSKKSKYLNEILAELDDDGKDKVFKFLEEKNLLTANEDTLSRTGAEINIPEPYDTREFVENAKELKKKALDLELDARVLTQEEGKQKMEERQERRSSPSPEPEPHLQRDTPRKPLPVVVPSEDISVPKTKVPTDIPRIPTRL